MAETINGVTYSNLPDKRKGVKISNILTQAGVNTSDVASYMQSNDFYCLVNAIDIDWNGILVDLNLTLNTTADLINWVKTLSKPQYNPKDFGNIQFDYTVETQEDYEELFGKINTNPNTNINVLLRNNTFVSTLDITTHTINSKNILIYGDNATVMAYNVLLEDLFDREEDGYRYYDLSSVWQNDIPGFATLIDSNGEYVPYNFLSYTPVAYPTIVDEDLKIAKVALPSSYTPTFANRGADFFKYSYIRISSCWKDSKATILYSDENYIYFKYLTEELNGYYADGFNIVYANAKLYGLPVVRIYNINEYFGVSIDSNKTLRIPTNISAERVVLSDNMLCFNHCPNVLLEGLNFIGSAPFKSYFEDSLSAGAIKCYQNTAETSFIMRGCKSNGICSPLVRGENPNLTFNRFLVDSCDLTLHNTLIRQGFANQYIVRNNKIRGSKNSFSVMDALISGSIKTVRIYQNEVTNAGYNFIASTEYNTTALNSLSGKIYANHIYCTPDFLNSKESFYADDGGAIYVSNRSDDVFEIFDNVIHDIPVSCGIYLDGGCSNALVERNLIYNTRIAINVNGENNPKNPSLTLNTNIGINSNLIGNRCVITSATVENNNCLFTNNKLFREVLNDKPFNRTGAPLNFTMSNNSIIANKFIVGGVIIPALNEIYGPCVSSFIKLNENSKAPDSIMPTRNISWLLVDSQSGKLRFYHCADTYGRDHALRFTGHTIAPISNLQFSFDLIMPVFNNIVHISIVKGTPYIEQISSNARAKLTYGYVLFGDDGYTFDVYLKINSDQVEEFWNTYCSVDNLYFSNSVRYNGVSESSILNALYITPYNTTEQVLDRSIPNIVRDDAFNHRGTTASRPTTLGANDDGYEYYDTDINKMIYFRYNNGNSYWQIPEIILDVTNTINVISENVDGAYTIPIAELQMGEVLVRVVNVLWKITVANITTPFIKVEQLTDLNSEHITGFTYVDGILKMTTDVAVMYSPGSVLVVTKGEVLIS